MRTIIGAVVVIAIIAGAWFIIDSRGGGDVVGDNTNTQNGEVLGKGLPVVGTQATPNDIVVESPKIGDTVGSPLEVTGRARGGWYFEASAPVMVIDTTGKVLGQGFVMAEGEWMTEEFVPFRGSISFDASNVEGGAMIFMNDNPSGDESRAKYLAVPVFFD